MVSLIYGCPSCGKSKFASTFRERLARRPRPVFIVNTDDIISSMMISTNRYGADRSKEEAHRLFWKEHTGMLTSWVDEAQSDVLAILDIGDYACRRAVGTFLYDLDDVSRHSNCDFLVFTNFKSLAFGHVSHLDSELPLYSLGFYRSAENLIKIGCADEDHLPRWVKTYEPPNLLCDMIDLGDSYFVSDYFPRIMETLTW